MSLETKIDQLTAVIERLIVAIESQSTPAPTQAPVPVPPSVPAPAQAPSITVDELQAICLALVRSNPANKPKIKDTLSSFGAKVLADLKPVDYADVKMCLEAMGNV